MEARTSAWAIIDSMVAPVVLVDGDGRITFSNKAWNEYSSANGASAEDATCYLSLCEGTVGIKPENHNLVRLAIESAISSPGDDITIEVPYEIGSRCGWYSLRIAAVESEGEQYAVIFHTNISGRKNIQEQLRKNEDRLAAQAQILEHIKDALVVSDLDGTIRSWNPGAQRIYGYAAHEVLGKHLRLLLPEGEPYDITTDVWEKLQEIGYCEIEGYRRNNQGKLFYAQTSLSMLRSADGDPTGLISYTIDVTEKRQIADELQASLQQLEEALETANELSVAAKAANEAKSEFLANMSHEIRTPMNGVIGMTELLIGTDLSEEQREYAQTIESSAASLLKVLNDILDFSKIEAGKLALEAQPFNLRETLEVATDLFAPQAQSKGIELTLDIPITVPTVVMGDELRIRQIITNLIGNAMKFTQTGEVVVGVDLLGQGAGKVALELWVRDSGPGIPQDRRDAIFDSFTQGDSSTTRRHGGTGLGLAICKNLCHLMNGTIGVESELGKGSKFWVAVTLPSAMEALPPLELPECEGKRVLILEPNSSTRKVLKEVLSYWGATCEEAGYLDEVLAYPSDSFDLVITSDSIDAKLFTWHRVLGLYPVGIKPSANAPYAAVMQKPVKLRNLWRVLKSLLGTAETASDESWAQAA